MNRLVIFSFVMLAVPTRMLYASSESMRAEISGRGFGNEQCTVEVTVDGSAEIEISADMAHLRTPSGQPAVWRRFRCSAPLPSSPADFRVVRINGRGDVRLVRHPRTNKGTAVIRISDPQRGAGNYTVDVQWGGYPHGSPLPPPPRPGSGRFPVSRAVEICQGSVSDRLNLDGYRRITFDRTTLDDRPGRNDWIVGTVIAQRRLTNDWFSFACSVDFNRGRVRSVDLQRR